MKKSTLLIITILALQVCAIAQNPRIDSLNHVLSSAKADTSKLNILSALGGEYISISDFENVKKTAAETLQLADKILSKAEKGSDVWRVAKTSQARSYTNLGIVNRQQGDYAESLQNHAASIRISEEIDDKKSLGGSYVNIGSIYWEQNNYPEALDNFLTGLKILEEIDYKPFIANAYGNIGIIYAEMHNYPEALKYLELGLQIKQELGNKRGIANAYINIGSINDEMGNTDESLMQFYAADSILEEIGDRKGSSNAKLNIGNTLTDLGKYVEAMQYLTDALQIKTEIGDKEGIASAYNALGAVYQHLKKYNEARNYYADALTLSSEIGILDGKQIAYGGLAAVDSATGNWKSAFDYHKLHIAYRDSILNKESTKKAMQLQMQYDFDKKEAAIVAEQEKKDAIVAKELQREKLVRNGFIGGFSIVLLFALVFFTQRNKIRKGKQRSDELLLNILPETVAEELKEKGHADAKLFSEVTVMFTDFKGFTNISEQLTPAELVAEIDTCFKAFDRIMDKYHIEKIKTIGDAYMCAGGLPEANTSNAKDVVSAGLEIQQFMQQHLLERQKENKPLFEIRIGVHTGPVVAGIVGVKKFAYDIWGDTVNIAARMESSSEAGKVNISGTTYQLVKDQFQCIHRGKIEAKNKGEIDMYFVESVLQSEYFTSY